MFLVILFEFLISEFYNTKDLYVVFSPYKFWKLGYYLLSLSFFISLESRIFLTLFFNLLFFLVCKLFTSDLSFNV